MRPFITLPLILCLCANQFVLAQKQERKVDIYVSDAAGFNTGPYSILKINQEGTESEIFIDDQLDWPQDIVFIEDQNVVLISNLNSGRITRYDASTGDYLDNFASGIGGPTRMELRNDTLYVLQWVGDGLVLRFLPDGTRLDPFTSVGVNNAIGLDWDTEGNLYVSSFAPTPSVRKFDPSGQDLGLIIDSELSSATNIAFYPQGSDNLLVFDYNTGNVQQFDVSGRFIGTFISGLLSPEGFDVLPNGNILIGSGGTASIQEFDSNGDPVREINPTSPLTTPNAIVLRDQNQATSTRYTALPQIAYLTPSLGVQFHVPSEIQSFQVLSMSGQVLARDKGNRIWDASDLTDGMYIVIAKDLKGDESYQRIKVVH